VSDQPRRVKMTRCGSISAMLPPHLFSLEFCNVYEEIHALGFGLNPFLHPAAAAPGTGEDREGGLSPELKRGPGNRIPLLQGRRSGCLELSSPWRSSWPPVAWETVGHLLRVVIVGALGRRRCGPRRALSAASAPPETRHSRRLNSGSGGMNYTQIGEKLGCARSTRPAAMSYPELEKTSGRQMPGRRPSTFAALELQAS